jgi:SAM-dependent methyltransferase
MSPWLCDYANETFGVPMLCGPVEDLQLEPESYDAILMMDVIEHMTDPVRGLQHVFRALKPDGIVVMQTPQWCHAETPYETLVARKDRFLDHFKPDEHLYLFTQEALTRALKDAGFDEIVYEKPVFDYDMYVFAGKTSVNRFAPEAIKERLCESGSGRFVDSFLELYDKTNSYAEQVAILDRECRKRLEIIEELSEKLIKYGSLVPAPLRPLLKKILEKRGL